MGNRISTKSRFRNDISRMSKITDESIPEESEMIDFVENRKHRIGLKNEEIIRQSNLQNLVSFSKMIDESRRRGTIFRKI